MATNRVNRVELATGICGWLSCALLGVSLGCSQGGDLAENRSALLLDPSFPGDATPPAADYTLFEADPARPIAVLSGGDFVVVADTVDDTLQLFSRQSAQEGTDAYALCGEVKVGLRPVAVSAVPGKDETRAVWVVNHVSDSVSVVHLDPHSCTGHVHRTLYVGDEPRDIVVARTSHGQARVFVTSAHRGQHHPKISARLGSDLVTPPSAKDAPGLADVFVFDATSFQLLGVVNLFTDAPRSLAVGTGVVYAAGYKTGNGTTLISSDRAAQVGVASLDPLLARDEAGRIIEEGDQLIVASDAVGQGRVRGGTPAVVGSGRCMPDPRPERHDPFMEQLCVQTDAEHRILAAHIIRPGFVSPACQCVSGDGTPQPTTSLILKFYSSMTECGEDFETFPDGRSGCWLDAAPGGVVSPAAHSGAQAPPMAFNEDVRLSLPDQDVFAIDVDTLSVATSYSGVGTVLFGMAVNPVTGDVAALNTDAHNLTRFEGPGDSSSTTVRGHLHESRVTILAGGGEVLPVHLNSHIDYASCCDKDPAVQANSLAFPTAGVFSGDGQRLYFTALGSDKVAVVDTSVLTPGFDNSAAREQGRLLELYAGPDVGQPSGPVGLALSPDGQTLFVKTHFTNELLVLDSDTGQVRQRTFLPSPEPESIRRGRSVLYNARLTSSHGDSACASCHVFGDMDGLSWNLGDPDAPTVKNPGPFALAAENNYLSKLALDPTLEPYSSDFRSNKGPMATQTLRGMANHGAQHWRGDRTRRSQDVTGAQPNFGSLDEDSSFGEFDVAIVGLNGNDVPLDAETFQDFTNFALQLTLPPNPVRALDDTLTPDQAAGRALFFGCASMSDSQYEARRCRGTDGTVVNVDHETLECACASNAVIRVLDVAPSLLPFAQTIQELLGDSSISAQFFAIARSGQGLPREVAPVHAQLVSELKVAVDRFVTVGLSLDDRRMIPRDVAQAFSDATGALLRLLGLSDQFGTTQASDLLGLLLSHVPETHRGAGSPFESPEAFAGVLPEAFAISNLTIRVQVDELARGTAAFRNLRQDCEVGVPRTCRLRITDSLQTCNGCHTLDPSGNAEFGAYRPGFFGSDGRYSFENESQVMKVPHLRNLYQKAGMFGTPQMPFNIPVSALGDRRGGLFAPDTNHQGPQVRGYGFMHDGAMDTVHRFFGATVFARRAENPPFDPGNPGAFEAILPAPESREACVSEFRAADLGPLPPLEPEVLAALGLCLDSGPIPDACFLEPQSEVCQATLLALAESLEDPDFPQIFSTQIRFLCFQMGSTLQGGAASGSCHPQGLTERAQMENFMMAFDTNLRPMVGQQVTLAAPGDKPPLLRPMLAAAAKGHCDVAAFHGAHGYVMTRPRPGAPAASQLRKEGERPTTLGRLLARHRPITLTCYPPQVDQAEAWQATR